MRWRVENLDNNKEQNLRCWSCKCHHVQKRETDMQLLVTVSCKVNVTKAIHEKTQSAIRKPLPPSAVILTMNVSRSDNQRIYPRQHMKLKIPRRRGSSSWSMRPRGTCPRSYTAMPFVRPSRAAAAAASSARFAVLPYRNESEFAAPFPLGRASAPVELAASALSGR